MADETTNPPHVPELEPVARAGCPAVRHRDAPTRRRPVLASGVPAGTGPAAYGPTSTLPFRAVSGPPDGHGAGMVRPYAIAHEKRRKGRSRVESPCAPHGMVVIR